MYFVLCFIKLEFSEMLLNAARRTHKTSLIVVVYFFRAFLTITFGSKSSCVCVRSIRRNNSSVEKRFHFGMNSTSSWAYIYNCCDGWCREKIVCSRLKLCERRLVCSTTQQKKCENYPHQTWILTMHRSRRRSIWATWINASICILILSPQMNFDWMIK